MYRVLTELTIIVHLAFIVFVVAGGLLIRRWRWVIPVHLAALAWAIYAELSPGIICPLTAVENFFADQAGIAGYSGDFIAHYLVPVIYQEGVPLNWQRSLAMTVLLLNAIVYGWRRIKSTRKDAVQPD